ncbi:hypothetical protein N9064_00415 [bacterium]|nr:hypothetical protein [bacterium]
MDEPIAEKKKRGRKPKEKPPTEEKTYKKRGRRPKIKNEEETLQQNDKKYSLFKDDNNELSLILESCIIHLRVNSKDVSKIDKENEDDIVIEPSNGENSLGIVNYDGVQYLENKNSHEEENNEQLYSLKIPKFNMIDANIVLLENIENTIETCNETNIIDLKMSQNKRKVKNIMEFFKNSWLEKSPYACWNCTEHFDNFPIGIPININDAGKFNLCGNFCSFSCAARHLIETENGEIMHERMSMLNLLAKKLTGDNKYNVTIASSRLALKKFGGSQSIDDYRANNVTKYKEIHIYKPPLTPVLYLMEEYVNHVKKDYKKSSKPIHFDRESFMNTYDKTRKNAANNVKDDIMRNFVGITKE